MNRFYSKYDSAGAVRLPAFKGTRILMMPIYLDDILGSLPKDLRKWTDVVDAMNPEGKEGVAYLTIDERFVRRNQSHRRPGLHVDGWNEDGNCGTWGGGGGAWGDNGWATVASVEGCAAWQQEFQGAPAEFGDCDHMRSQLDPARRVVLQSGHIYMMKKMTVHETLPQVQTGRRQFVRLSMPSGSGWPESCTPNPRGIKPFGAIVSARPSVFTQYQPR